MKLTPDSFAEKTANDIVLVAIDENNTLLGTTSFSILKDRQGKQYAYNKYSAVISTTKQMGIGSSLLQCEKRIAINEGCCYIISDTCEHAKWSVKWHEKNGFKIVGLKSFDTNDYYSLIFRLQLDDTSIWSSSFYCMIRFFLSWFKTRLMYDTKGNITLIGSVVIKIIQLL